MGTSSSHSSPKTPNWKAASLGYIHSDIPIKKMISIIWSAAENQPEPISKLVESDTIFKCQEAVRNSANVTQAFQEVEKVLFHSKDNSVISEFAKRSVAAAFTEENPVEKWRAALFSEITDYLVSRDASGYVGTKYRNKTITDLVKFKEDIKKEAFEIAKKIKLQPLTANEWKDYVSTTIKEIQKIKL